MLVGGSWRQQAHHHEDDQAHQDPPDYRGIREQPVYDHEDNHDDAAGHHGRQSARCGRAPPEEGAHYGYEQGAGQEVVGHRQGSHHIADDERDHERDDTHEQGGYAVYQDFVVLAPDDETGVDVAGEDGGRG